MTAGVRIAVTGVGAVSPFGEGAETLWKGLTGGESGVIEIDRFDTSGFGSHLGALVRSFEPRKTIPPSVLRRLDLVSRYAVPAAAEALAEAAPPSKESVGVILGTNSAGAAPVSEVLTTIASMGPAAAPPILFPYTVANAPASQCALILGLKGPNITIAQKEVSSAGAIASACRILASGGASGILAGGSDEVSVHVYEVLDRLKALSRDSVPYGGGPEGSRPFDRSRNGFVCGEGAAFLFLETEACARSRHARILAIIDGAAEGRAPVLPHGLPTAAAPFAGVMTRALAASGHEPEAVSAVFGTGNSTRVLDATEAGALRLAFSGSPPPVCSVRGALGESGTAGAYSAIAACFAFRDGRLPGTAGLLALDETLGLDVASAGRALRAGHLMISGLASGGGAAALVMAAP